MPNPVLNSLLNTPARLAFRASAVASARSAASVSDVWAVLAHPARWGEFEPFVRVVTDDKGSPVPADEEIVAARGHLNARLRLLTVSLPIEVEHVVHRSSLALSTVLFPGLREEVEHLLLPTSTGGALVTARLTLHGPFALPALVPRWLLRTMTVRLLARAAEGRLRERTREVPSVA